MNLAQMTDGIDYLGRQFRAIGNIELGVMASGESDAKYLAVTDNPEEYTCPQFDSNLRVYNPQGHIISFPDPTRPIAKLKYFNIGLVICNYTVLVPSELEGSNRRLYSQLKTKFTNENGEIGDINIDDFNKIYNQWYQTTVSKSHYNEVTNMWWVNGNSQVNESWEEKVLAYFTFKGFEIRNFKMAVLAVG